MRFLLLSSLLIVSTAFIVNGEENPCHAYSSSPSACMKAGSCAFCVQDGFDHKRCDDSLNLQWNGCSIFNICDPNGNTVIETSPEESDPCEGDVPPPVVPICPDMTRNVTVTFKLQSHPVDVYLLMDFSGSMSDDKANVVKLSESLKTAVNKMSPDHRLGFGTFVDKPKSPFGSTGDYSFRNNMPLTDDVSGFASAVSAVPIKSGGDGPESQLDGMFQSAACVKDIGWRSNTRRILIMATDANYHFHGEGARYGLTAFDEACSLDASGLYTNEIKLDYPSEAQIVKTMQDNQITPIFAVTSGVERFYQHFVDKITPSGMGTLTSDSSNIIDVILNEYHKIESRVEMEHDSTKSEFDIKFYSTCQGKPETETLVCEGLKPEDITFTIQVSLLDCPSVFNDKEIVKVNPKGLPTFAEMAFHLICKTDW